MHDCVKTREQLIDLVFNEMEPAEGRRLLNELDGCGPCLKHYRSMAETLRVVDQAVEATMPDESYWPGYESGLRARLQNVRPGLRQRLKAWIGGFGFFRPLPITAAALLTIVLLACGWWLSSGLRQTVTPPTVITQRPGVIRPQPPEPVATPNKQELVHSLDRKRTIRRRRSSPVLTREERPAEKVAVDSGPAQIDQTSYTASLLDPETSKHFEKTQLLLRSFRNSITSDPTYEKELSQKLLYRNILLRREAEAKRNLFTEEVLGELEPLLLDIANLPESPSRNELKSISERIQRKDLVAVLQIYSAQTALPVYRNQ